MRTLLILRGAPGCGKSTWVKNNGLSAYTLCPDDIRVMCASRELKADGAFAIARNHAVEQETWKIILDLLEYRMSRGELTVLDATASKTKDIKQYKELADQYRYRMYCVDFTDVPLDVCKKQNLQRPEDKWVPEQGIENIYARFATQPVPAGVEVIKPDELDKILEKPIDLSSYRKIVFIGDIHGCYDTLMQYFKDGLEDDVEYIFLGDYIDRGNQNAEVMNWLYSIKDRPNVCLLEGNHERHLQAYGMNVEAKSKEFEEKTKGQLILGGFDEKKARIFYRKLRQMSHFTYNGIEVLATHGGIPCMRANLTFIPTTAFINGVGEYNDYQDVADTWMKETNENQYQVHGHRNTAQDPVQLADRVFNLEGEVEFGGKLRIVELIEDGAVYTDELGEEHDLKTPPRWNIIELANCQPLTEDFNVEKAPVETVEQAVEYLRNNQFVKEKKLGNGISSFNFTREAFYSANWTRQTVLARGLFIDTDNNQIMARSYEKFFRINEVRETEMVALKNRLKFPVKAYVKENGFLGIVSYNYKTDDLFIATKSSDKGDCAEYFKVLLEPYKEKLLEQLRTHYNFGMATGNGSLTYVFECVDQENDPHIIKYDKSDIYLLDIILNDLEFAAYSYDDLKIAAQLIGCPVKKLAYTIKDYDEFRDLVNRAEDEDYKYNGNYIEGYVFVDQTGFMTKLKTGYYNFWKHMRSVADSTLRCGSYRRMGSLLTVQGNQFAAFCKECFNKDRIKETKSYPYKTDIISLREKFLFSK